MARKNLTDEELRIILEESDSESEYEFSEDDEGDEDHVEVETHIPDEVQAEEDEDYDEDVDTPGISKEIIYKSKSRLQWTSTPPASTRRLTHNIVNAKKVGLQNASLQITSVLDAFKLFITDDMLRDICVHTNRQGNSFILKWNEVHPEQQKRWKNVSLQEMQAFIGVFIAGGRNRGRKLHITEMWTENDLFKQPYFTAVLSRNRFIEIYRHIRFDDPTTRNNRIQASGDKLEAIRQIYDSFVNNCITNFSPNTNLTVDERLATFRGKCPFRVYIKSKPGRYGIKIWVCADSDTAYILNSQVYTGMVNNQREVNQGQRVVLDMVRPYFGSWRGVTTDNFFTSIPLAQELFNQRLTIAGTLRVNKREVPNEFLPHVLRPDYSSIFGFSDNLTLVSYVPKKRKGVLLLSTQFHGVQTTGNEQNKPEINIHYNKTKGAVDTGDHMTREYSCVRTTRRWPLRIFMEIIDMAALNAYIVFKQKYPDVCADRSYRRHFLQKLAQEIALPNVQQRKLNNKNYHKSVKNAIELFLNQNEEQREENLPANLPQTSTSSRCSFCPRKRDRKSRISCQQCGKTVCNIHRKEVKKYICLECENLNV